MMMNISIKESLNDCLNDDTLRDESTLFVLHQSDSKHIQSCAISGVRILLPNLFLSHTLIWQTIVREARRKVVLSGSMWELLQKSMATNPAFANLPEFIVYKNAA